MHTDYRSDFNAAGFYSKAPYGFYQLLGRHSLFYQKQLGIASADYGTLVPDGDFSRVPKVVKGGVAYQDQVDSVKAAGFYRAYWIVLAVKGFLKITPTETVPETDTGGQVEYTKVLS